MKCLCLWHGPSFYFCPSLFLAAAGLHLLQVSNPRSPYPDKTTISSDSVVSVFHIKLSEQVTDVKIAHSHDSFTLQLVACKVWGSIVVMGMRGEGREEQGSYLWKQVAMIQRWHRKQCISHLTTDWVEIQVWEVWSGKWEQDNVRQLIKHVQWDEERTEHKQLLLWLRLPIHWFNICFLLTIRALLTSPWFLALARESKALTMLKCN